MAVIESDFSYKNCCNDEIGKASAEVMEVTLIFVFYFKVYLHWAQREMFQTLAQKGFASPLQISQSQLGYLKRCTICIS